MKQWICLMLTLALLVCTIPLGVVVAQGEVSITSPVAGSFLEAGMPVVITVQADTAPELTANGTPLTAPVSDGNGGWDFSWTPQEAGVVNFRASNANSTDEKNVFVGATGGIEIQTAQDAGDTVITPKGLDDGADVVVLAFDVAFTSVGETVTLKDSLSAEIVSLTATAAEAAGVVAIFDNATQICSLFVNGKQTKQADIISADCSQLRLSGAETKNIEMRQSAEPGLSIISPIPDANVMVGDALQVMVKTNGMSAGQNIKVIAKDGTSAVAEPVEGTVDEYLATFDKVTDKFHSVTAVIEESGVETDPVPLTLLADTLLKSWNFNDGILDTEGSLDAKEELFWNSRFTYKNGKTGEGFAAYNSAPTAGAWQGGGLGINFKNPPSVGRMIVEYDIHIDGKFIYRFQNSTGAYKDAFSFNGSGAIWNSMVGANASKGYTPSAWQRHKLVFDYENGTVKLYIDSELVIDQKWEDLKTAGTLKSVVLAVCRKDSGGNAAYVDNLSVYTTKQVIAGDDGEVVTGGIGFASPGQNAVLEKGRPVTLKVNVTGAETVAFYANESQIGSKAVEGNVAACIWTPDTAGTVTLKAAAESMNDEIAVEVVETELYYSESFDGPEITETDKINTWGGLQNFDDYRAGGADGGKYGVMQGSGANKYVILNGAEPKNPGIYMVEMTVRFPAGSPASIGLTNRNDSLGSNEMFYIGSAGAGYHDAITGTWTSVAALPADQWLTVKYIENIDEATRAIYVDGEEIYQGPVKHNHSTFGGLAFTMNTAWKETHEFHVDNLRISTATSQFFARSATMSDNNTIRLTFSKAISLYRLGEAVKVYRGDTEIPVTYQKNSKYLDLIMSGDGVGSISTEYTVVVSDILTAEDGLPLKKAETFRVRSAGQSANVDTIVWKSGEKKISSLTGLKKNDTVVLSLNVKSDAAAARVVLGIYTQNENGAVVLKQSAVSKGMLSTGASTSVSAEFTLENDIAAGDYMKAFILDADTAVPLADPIMIKAN